MKKIYIKPMTDAADLETMPLMANSPLFTLEDDNTFSQSLEEPVPTTDATSGNLSRGYDVWGDSDL